MQEYICTDDDGYASVNGWSGLFNMVARKCSLDCFSSRNPKSKPWRKTWKKGGFWIPEERRSWPVAKKMGCLSWEMGRGWFRTNLLHKCGIQSIRSGDGRGKKLLVMTQKNMLMVSEKKILLFLSRKKFQGILDEWVKTRKKNNSCFSTRHFWHWRMEQNQRERIVKQTCSLENGTEGKMKELTKT